MKNKEIRKHFGCCGFSAYDIVYTAHGLIYGLFDRPVIEYYRVGRTNAWNIPGTEDLKPYIPMKTMINKRFGTPSVHPLFCALAAKGMTFFGK